MATSTNKYKLTKPELSEKVQVEVVNSNMDIIDATMGELQNQSTANHNKAETTAINLQNHMNDRNNPHGTTKGQLGLGNVENKSSATIRGELTMDNVTNALGYVPYTPNEVDNKLSALETKIDWKEAVDTFNDIAASYPNPQDGWTVNVKDTDYTYRFNGDKWVVISANAIPKATQAVDGLLSKEDKTNYDDANSKKHTHSNKSVLDKITQSLLDNWNAAYTHISDTIKHISSVERANWTDAYDKRHTHTNKSVLDGITTALISAWNTAKAHADSDHARIDATKVEKSETNGNIKINGTETNVYTHPGGTNPHGLTKNDIGLNNVENKSSDTIRSELTRKNVTDALGYTPPETIPSVDISGKMNRSGDTMTGALNLANNTWNNIGDDVAIGDRDVAGTICLKGINGHTGISFKSMDDTSAIHMVYDEPTHQIMIDGIGIRDLYNKVVALESTANRRFTQIINLTAGYDPNIWYPVVGSDIPQAGMRYLNAYTLLYQCKPSWSTHVGGYSCNITMLVNGSGWGANKENMNLCLNQVCAWTQNNSENPVSFSNLLQSQTPVLYCRGGGYYTVVTDWQSLWTPITTSYTKNDQTVVPIGSSPRVNIDGASGSVVYGKDRYITKNDRIENNTFTDELVHNGFWKLGDFADANYAKSIGIDENTGDFYAIVFNYYGAGDSHTMGFGNIILLSPRLGTKFYFIQVWNKSLHVKKFG